MKKLLHTIYYYLFIDSIELTNEIKIELAAALRSQSLDYLADHIYKISVKRRPWYICIKLYVTKPEIFKGELNHLALLLEIQTGEDLFKIHTVSAQPFKLFKP